MALLIRSADGDDLMAVVDVGRRTLPVTYVPIAGEDYVKMVLAKWWTQDATIPAIRAGRVTVAQIRLSYLDGNSSAEAFYRSRGFVEINRERGGDGLPQDVWMELVLDPEPAADLEVQP